MGSEESAEYREDLKGYELSRRWFDFCFENSELVNPTHTALYFFCIEMCNRLGWKRKFGLPTQMAMDAIGVKSWKTYKKAFDDIVSWGFVELAQKSKNQYTANVIAIVNNTIPNTKALARAMLNQTQTQCSSTVDIDKPVNKKPVNKIPNQRLGRENSYKFPPLTLRDNDFLFVLKTWNSICANFRSIVKIDGNKSKKRGSRKQSVRNRLNEMKELTENGTKEEVFLFLENLFKKVNTSKFLKGDNQRGWKADFDWLFKNDKNWVKVYEGNYTHEQL